MTSIGANQMSIEDEYYDDPEYYGYEDPCDEDTIDCDYGEWCVIADALDLLEDRKKTRKQRVLDWLAFTTIGSKLLAKRKEELEELYGIGYGMQAIEYCAFVCKYRFLWEKRED